MTACSARGRTSAGSEPSAPSPGVAMTETEYARKGDERAYRGVCGIDEGVRGASAAALDPAARAARWERATDRWAARSMSFVS